MSYFRITINEFALRDLEKPRYNSIRTAGNSAQIKADYLPVTKPENYRYTNLVVRW
jgi:hypothetical protein